MENNMFSGIFRGLKIKNREKSQFFTHLVEAAGVFSVKNNPSRRSNKALKPLKKRGFSVRLFTGKQGQKISHNFFRGFFGDFFFANHPSLEGGGHVDIHRSIHALLPLRFQDLQKTFCR